MLLRWVMQNPQAVQDAFKLLNLLASMQAAITVPDVTSVAAGFKSTPKISDTNIVFPIPLKFPNPYAVPTGTISRATFATGTVTTAQLAQRVAALIMDLQYTGQAATI